jgi:2,3-diketo-5-methylthio-1-phosphopentane phosphatase/methylthioribulose-1-phosphate dehydratase
MIRALLLDIEGTTSSLEFVRDVLLPYAREHLAAFIAERRGDPEVDALLAESERLLLAEGASTAEPVAALERWMAEDRKATPLKALQGLLWEAAFRRGAFIAHVYPDVAPALRLFRERGLRLYVYSSGSVRAQRAFFRHSAAGDLTALFDGWFDTRTGSKSEPASYRAIADSIGLEPGEVAFLSDSRAELDAARGAGLVTFGLLRGPLALADHPAVARFDELPCARHEAHDVGSSQGGAEVARAQVIELAQHCHARGWALATSGNFSVRVSREQIAITASGIDKGRVTPNGVLLVALDGTALEPGSPSAETPLHTALYRSSAAIGAVVHTHSVAGTVLSRRHASMGSLRLSGYEMSKALVPASNGALAELVLPIVANRQDTRELAIVLSQRLEQAPAHGYLVAGHGLTTWGADAAAARRHVEALEFMLACELASQPA